MPIVIKRADGGVSIMRLVPFTVVEDVLDDNQRVIGTQEVQRLPDVDEEIAKWQQSHPGEYVSHREMPEEAIPTDRTYRAAWRDTTPELVIDIDDAVVPVIHNNAIQAQIEAIERATLMNRAIREDLIDRALAKAQGLVPGITAEQLYAHPSTFGASFKKLVDANNELAALRRQRM